MTRPTICFATMCRNEEKCIYETIVAASKVADYAIIYDTGSTDGTFKEIERARETWGVSGGRCRVIRATWEGFATSKTKMMAAAKEMGADLIMHLDADDLLVSFDVNEIDPTKHCHYATLERGGETWQATILYDGKFTWRFLGVAHTVIRPLEVPQGEVSTGFLPSCRVRAEPLGKRAEDPLKYAKDAELLAEQFRATLASDPDGLNPRSAFYCAQSYFDAKDFQKAYDWYGTYLARPTWNEEVFEAHLRRARCAMSLKLPRTVVEAAYVEACREEPERAEPHLYFGTWLNQQGAHEAAYATLKHAQSKNLHEVLARYILFVNRKAYGKHVNDELAVACYWTGRIDEGLELVAQIIDDPDFAFCRAGLLANQRFLEGKRHVAVEIVALLGAGAIIVDVPEETMHRPAARVVIADNFYRAPDRIRELALSQMFIESPDYHKGRRTRGTFANVQVREDFERLLGRKITKWDYPVNGAFQLCTARDQLVYHADAQQYAAAIYLSPLAPLDSGLSLYRCRATGARAITDHPAPSFERGFYDRSQFEEVDRIGFVYNRCVIWDAKLIHAATSYFGDKDDNARLFQMFFFDVD